MNAVVAQTNKMLTWQEIFAQAARQPFARLASYTSESQERMTRNVYPAVWAIERFVDKSLANPKVAVVGATIAAMSFDAMLLPVFNRLCRQGITWTISAPAAPKPGRAKFNELNLVKKPTVLRQDTPAALDKISDTADVLMIHSTLGLEQAREIVDHPAFNQYTQDGKYLLWGADTELGLGIIGRWLNARGYTTSQSVRQPFN